MTAAALLTIVLGSASGSTPTHVTPPDVGDPLCSPVPPEPRRIDARPFASTATDGTRTWGAEASYELTSGDIGEAFMVVDSDGTGEAQLMINGEIIAHVAIESPTSSPAPVLTTWMPAAVNHPPELIAEMMRVDLPLVLAESLPQEFKCSPFGKTAMRVAGILWRAGIGAAGTACCALTSPSIVGCMVCGAGAATAIHEGSKVIDGHCD